MSLHTTRVRIIPNTHTRVIIVEHNPQREAVKKGQTWGKVQTSIECFESPDSTLYTRFTKSVYFLIICSACLDIKKICQVCC